MNVPRVDQSNPPDWQRRSGGEVLHQSTHPVGETGRHDGARLIRRCEVHKARTGPTGGGIPAGVDQLVTPSQQRAGGRPPVHLKRLGPEAGRAVQFLERSLECGDAYHVGGLRSAEPAGGLEYLDEAVGAHHRRARGGRAGSAVVRPSSRVGLKPENDLHHPARPASRYFLHVHRAQPSCWWMICRNSRVAALNSSAPDRSQSVSCFCLGSIL